MNGQNLTITYFASISKYCQNISKEAPCKIHAFLTFSYVIPWERQETEAIKENLEYHPLWSCCLRFQIITQVWSVAVPDDWALHTATSPWNLDETALKWGLSSQSMCCTNARASLSTSLHQSVSAALPVWHQLLSLPGTMSWLCWWLICGTLWQRSHHFPCAYPTLTPGAILETPADSAFLTKLPT